MITEKSAVLMIVWNAFAVLSFFSCKAQLTTFPDKPVLEYSVMAIFYPTIGLIADSFLGRYKTLSVSSYLMTVAVALRGLKELLLSNSLFLTYFIEAILGLAGVCYFACIFQFTTDQLVGASGEQLSFAIYWLIWGCING